MENLSDMGIFAKVVELQGFSKAATALNMSKSNVSRRIASLEDRLEIRLLQRTTRKIGLTDSGRLYFEFCSRVLAEAQQADYAMNKLKRQPSGQLTVSLPETFGRFFVMPILPSFMDKYPEIRIKLSLTNRKLDLIDEGYDVAIRKGDIDDQSLIAVKLGVSQQHLYASREYLERHGAPETAKDLLEHDCLSAAESNNKAEFALYRDGKSTAVTVRPRFAIQDHGVVFDMVRAGVGIALVPGFLCNEDLKTGKIVRVMENWTGPSVPFHAVYPSYRGLAPNVRVFLDFIKENLMQKTPWANTRLRPQEIRKKAS
ncbi:MAG: LysR family transcriptional regulator [Sneathiella sp.]